MNGQHQNAIAGPSKIKSGYSISSGPPSTTIRTLATVNTPTSSFPFPSLYLPPPAPAPPIQHLTSTQDLLLRLQLLPSYDKYVRPYVHPLGTSHQSDTLLNTNVDSENSQTATGTVETPMTGHVDKGKGRAVPIPGGDVEIHDAHDADEDDAVGKGEKKWKNSYKHLIKGIPGKHSTKKDDYLSTIILLPPKQRLKIRLFDEKTQEEAFTVSPEGLKGWNINALVVESAQAREDRKKRKEAKRAAKLQSQSNQPPPAATVPSISTTTTIVHPQPLHAPARLTSTLKPGAGTPRTGSTTSNVSIPTGAGANGAPRPISAVPRSGSAVPRPGSAVKPVTTSQGQVGTPVTTRTITPMEVDQQRGKKREREESTSLVNGTHANGVVNGYVNGGANAISNGLPQQTSVASNSKAGTVSARPRPIKKQRMDIQGQARDISGPVQQQPTPQGV